MIKHIDCNGTEIHTGDTVKVTAYGRERMGWVKSHQYQTINLTKVGFANGDWATYSAEQIKLVKRFAESEQMPRMTNDKVAEFNVYQQPTEKS